ncbi:Hypothetical protein CINCED_3A014371 [Cinara cedri]|uniref:Uncharacterized protein n=1 Tax=Cinara cedri TaxID=506608 RepID=A0A5E4N7V4_9HEMI|nr:Hypothetical protein CINCED_3A014371 [Cinara cedri]
MNTLEIRGILTYYLTTFLLWILTRIKEDFDFANNSWTEIMTTVVLYLTGLLSVYMLVENNFFAKEFVEALELNFQNINVYFPFTKEPSDEIPESKSKKAGGAENHNTEIQQTDG